MTQAAVEHRNNLVPNFGQWAAEAARIASAIAVRAAAAQSGAECVSWPGHVTAIVKVEMVGTALPGTMEAGS
eukprot:4165082-Amphidinium_carterae.1